MKAEPTSQKHTPPGWPKTPFQMLERIEKRWFELQDRDISNHDFACLMSGLSDFICEHKTFESDIISALKSIRDGNTECKCDHTTQDCCNVVGAYCSFCIAEAAIAKAEVKP